jgi:hypothetical protein
MLRYDWHAMNVISSQVAAQFTPVRRGTPGMDQMPNFR